MHWVEELVPCSDKYWSFPGFPSRKPPPPTISYEEIKAKASGKAPSDDRLGGRHKWQRPSFSRKHVSDLSHERKTRDFSGYEIRFCDNCIFLGNCLKQKELGHTKF